MSVPSHQSSRRRQAQSRSPLGIISNHFRYGNVVERRREGPSPSASPSRRRLGSRPLPGEGCWEIPAGFGFLAPLVDCLGVGGRGAPPSRGSVAKFCPRQSYREFRPFSGGNIEQRIDEGGLGDNVVPTDPFHLSFSPSPEFHNQSGCAMPSGTL